MSGEWGGYFIIIDQKQTDQTFNEVRDQTHVFFLCLTGEDHLPQGKQGPQSQCRECLTAGSSGRCWWCHQKPAPVWPRRRNPLINEQDNDAIMKQHTIYDNCHDQALLLSCIIFPIKSLTSKKIKLSIYDTQSGLIIISLSSRKSSSSNTSCQVLTRRRPCSDCQSDFLAFPDWIQILASLDWK